MYSKGYWDTGAINRYCLPLKTVAKLLAIRFGYFFGTIFIAFEFLAVEYKLRYHKNCRYRL